MAKVCEGIGEKSLHRAAWLGSEDEVQDLIYRGEDIDGLDEAGLTPLHHAVMSHSIEAVRLLLESGACVEVSEVRRSPLHYAAMDGEIEIMKALIGYGARVNAGDQDGKTPLYYAITNRQWSAEILLRLHGAGSLTARISSSPDTAGDSAQSGFGVPYQCHLY